MLKKIITLLTGLIIVVTVIIVLKQSQIIEQAIPEEQKTSQNSYYKESEYEINSDEFPYDINHGKCYKKEIENEQIGKMNEQVKIGYGNPENIPGGVNETLGFNVKSAIATRNRPSIVNDSTMNKYKEAGIIDDEGNFIKKFYFLIVDVEEINLGNQKEHFLSTDLHYVNVDGNTLWEIDGGDYTVGDMYCDGVLWE